MQWKFLSECVYDGKIVSGDADKGGMNNARKIVVYARMNEVVGLACSSANDKRKRWRGRGNAGDAMR